MWGEGFVFNREPAGWLFWVFGVKTRVWEGAFAIVKASWLAVRWWRGAAGWLFDAE
jgi:hypothetical protein